MFKSFLLPSFEISEKERNKIDSFLQILEESNVANIINKEIKKDKSNGGRPSYNPYRLFATIAYAFSKHSGSLRKIEESINYDLRFIYFMEQERPSYVTIAKFLNNVVVKHHKEIFSSIIKTILKKYDICIDDVFLDGTKIEANANKYKFVYKPTTFHNNLNLKIKDLLSSYFFLPRSKKTFTSKEIATYLSSLSEIILQKGIDLNNTKRGRGKKLDPIVKDYHKLSSFLLKCLEYEEKENICGNNRNSYFKTDKDATAMCLKEDYYSGLGSNTHAGYNVQILVSKGIVLDYYVCQDRTDYFALIPLLNSFNEQYGFYPKRLCADAGYGSLYNYQFLNLHNIENYVKYQNWQQDILGKRIDLFYFDENKNLICLNNKIAVPFSQYNGRHPKSKGNLFYLIENCCRCKFKQICKENLKNKTSNNRVFETSYDMYRYKINARNNLISAKGIEMRVNRSSQVEGVFGVIKQDMDYTRIRRRGLENVSAEIMLVCLGYVIKKLFTIFDGNARLDYWKAPSNLLAEQLPKVDIKKLIDKKKRTKGKNELLRSKYKYKKRGKKLL